MNIHPEARTTPQIRAEIKAASGISQKALAEKYNVTPQTIRKWQKRDQMTDKSHRPDKLQTTLSEAQEAIVVEWRKLLLLPLDDLLVVTRAFINEKARRSGLNRTLARHGVSNLRSLQKEQDDVSGESESAPKKSFKDYAPGFVHIDIKYLPKMPDQDSRSYLLVAIDRATRWVYFEVHSDKSANRAKTFLENVIVKAPFHINKRLTDNGKEFTDRFIANGEREPTGDHAFDKVCNQHGIEHRLIKPAHPQTNGMVERFNGRISEVVKQTRFASMGELKSTLNNYLKIYNHQHPSKKYRPLDSDTKNEGVV